MVDQGAGQCGALGSKRCGHWALGTRAAGGSGTACTHLTLFTESRHRSEDPQWGNSSRRFHLRLCSRHL